MKSKSSEGKGIKEKIIIWVFMSVIFFILGKSVVWVLNRNDGICKSRFGSEYRYMPTITSGYCLNYEEGIRKYLD